MTATIEGWIAYAAEAGDTVADDAESSYVGAYSV